MTSSETTIGPDSFVTISYLLYEEGKTDPIDIGGPEEGLPEEGGASAGSTDPLDKFRCRLSYVHGYGLMVSALERGLEGHASGTKVTVNAEPVDAFGMYEQDGVLEIEKDGLEGSEELHAGDEVLASGPEGEMIMRVLELRAETIVVDTNHPLAGKRVRFEVDILEVRAATDEEIEEAHEEVEEMADACGCGEEHDHSAHAPDAIEENEGLVQLGLPRRGLPGDLAKDESAAKGVAKKS